MMRRLICILAVLATSAFATALHASEIRQYAVESGDAMDDGEGAFSIWGGYPDSGLRYLASPVQYFDIGVQLEVNYNPVFALGMPLKVQLLESPAKTLNLSFDFMPNLSFSYATSEVSVFSKLQGGFSGGWKFYRGYAIFLNGAYAVELPLSPGEDGESYKLRSHYPIVMNGFELPLTRSFNLGLRGLARFRDYNPDEYEYGGHLIFTFGFWD